MPSPKLSNAPESMAEASSDRSLVAMVRDGNEWAAAQLYDRYARRLFGLVDAKLGHRLRSTMEPEDIVQSVFRSMFRGVQSGNYNAPPGETLWGILAAITFSKLCKKSEYHSALRRDSRRNLSIEQVCESAMTDESSADFLMLCIRETLDLLRPLDRDVLSLRIQGHSIRDIAETTGRSIRTVERSLQNTRDSLAQQLSKDT